MGDGESWETGNRISGVAYINSYCDIINEERDWILGEDKGLDMVQIGKKGFEVGKLGAILLVLIVVLVLIYYSGKIKDIAEIFLRLFD